MCTSSSLIGCQILCFTLLDAGYFCLPTDVLGLCTGMQLTYLKQFSLLELHFYDFFLDGSGVVLSLWLIVLHVHGKILSTSPITPKLWVFLVWHLGTGTIPRLVCMTGIVPPNPLGWFFSWAWIYFLYACVQLVGPMNSSCVSLPDSADFLSSGHQPARPAIQFAQPSVKWKCRPFVKIT